MTEDKKTKQDNTDPKSKSFFKKYKEIIMYIIFGIATTLVRWVTQWIFSAIFENILPKEPIDWWIFHYDSMVVFVATLISWILAVIFAFVTNKLWVFDSKSWKPSIAIREFWQFFLSRLITGIIEIGGVALLVGLGFNKLVLPQDTMDATVLMSAIIMVLNYIFSKLIVFKEKDPEKIKAKQKRKKLQKKMDKLEKEIDKELK